MSCWELGFSHKQRKVFRNPKLKLTADQIDRGDGTFQCLVRRHKGSKRVTLNDLLSVRKGLYPDKQCVVDLSNPDILHVKGEQSGTDTVDTR